ncbi:SPARC-like isoform X2 [Saccostrea echinata]|uniref:SPARC-like isoform X2 n=1 Tax=Saccostrea echinata TaxID=191078 RepID=UPI002A83644C|nr:SPARC-like isoform X2 [Saccostrea echinata]
MKLLLLLSILLALFVCFQAAEARDNRDRRDRREIGDYPDVEEEGADEDDDEEEANDDTDDDQGNDSDTRNNPCDSKSCKRGEECYLDKGNKARCRCFQQCTPEPDPRYMVCSNKNLTFDSECHMDREVCWCRRKQPQCGNPQFKNLRLDYYGECKKITPCEDFEMEQFPIRMSNWLFKVMEELGRRHELEEDYIEMLKSAEKDAEHVDAVIWKFCDLDIHPQDRFVTRREMLFVIATVKPMEHCLAPFLDLCDANKDRKISLYEWGSCLGIKQGIHDKCKAVHKKNRRRR